MDTTRLLVMDDDPVATRITVAMTAALGGVAQGTASVADLLRTIDEWAPTHIAVDLVMPGVDGVEVMNLLARRHCKARIIVCSGADEMVLNAAMRAAAANGLDVAGVLRKPFDREELQTLLMAARNPEPARLRIPPQTSPKATPPVLTEADLRQALRIGAIFPVCMPIIDCAVGELRAVEANARWLHRDRVLMPEHFIPLAERVGLIDLITESIATQAVAWLAEQPDRAFGLTLKLSAASLFSFNLVESLARICEHKEIDARRLTLQLSLSTAMTESVATLELLTRLRMQGFELSLGNFGGGTCSLLDLVRLPVSEIKIDHSLSEKIVESSERRAVCKCIVDLGASLRVRVTASGIDTREDLRFFSAIGAPYAMGYFFAPPMDAQAITAWSGRWRSSQNSRWEVLLTTGS